eukprot:204883-Rhodomonas_salina.1
MRETGSREQGAGREQGGEEDRRKLAALRSLNGRRQRVLDPRLKRTHSTQQIASTGRHQCSDQRKEKELSCLPQEAKEDSKPKKEVHRSLKRFERGGGELRTHWHCAVIVGLRIAARRKVGGRAENRRGYHVAVRWKRREDNTKSQKSASPVTFISHSSSTHHHFQRLCFAPRHRVKISPGRVNDLWSSLTQKLLVEISKSLRFYDKSFKNSAGTSECYEVVTRRLHTDTLVRSCIYKLLPTPDLPVQLVRY